MSTIGLIVGTTLGGAEYVADHLIDQLQQENHHTFMINQPKIDDLFAYDFILFITSTHGAGDFPENIAHFMADISDQKPDLTQVKYAIVAIGDSSYDTFCGAGKKANALFQQCQATSICPMIEIDVLNDPLPENAAEKWLDQQKHHFILPSN